MRNKIIHSCLILMITLLLISVFVTAELDTPEKQNQEQQGFNQFTDDFESELKTFEGQKLPSMLAPFISDESLLIEITLDTSEILIYHIIVDSGVITRAGAGTIEEPGYSIAVSQSFIEEHEGEAFGKALRDGLTTGEVTHTADGFWKKMKFSMMLAAVDVASLFQ